MPGPSVIAQFGWSDALEEAFEPYALQGAFPGRIVVQHRDGYLVRTNDGELRANALGLLFHEAEAASQPAVGDWVALSMNPREATATIHGVLPRRTAFVRRAAHSQHEMQVIAANIDVVFVVTSLNADLNPRRIERYLAAAWQSGARPVVVLTKSDLSDDAEQQAKEIAALSAGAPVLLVSARRNLGMDALKAQVQSGETCVLIGSSGVGKSTLANAFLGEDRMATQEIRENDDQGRHTTSHRQLMLLPGGGLILDTPGFREVGLIEADEGLSAVFDDIETLAAECRFNDCSHTHEPGCAIQSALQSGVLDPVRWEHFQKLELELAMVAAKAARVASDAERRRLNAQTKAYRTTKADRRGE